MGRAAPSRGWSGWSPSGPLLVHFFDLAQLNSARALPYVEAWSERYREHGLGTLGVHSPRFPFTRSPEVVAAALPRLGIEWPVAVDSEHAIWRAYGCRGWPSLFLWSRGGALRWYQLGEGEYEATELAIREALEEAGDPGTRLAGRRCEPLRAGDAPGARVDRRRAPRCSRAAARSGPGARAPSSPGSSSTTRPAAPSSPPTARARSRSASTESPREPVVIGHPGLHALDRARAPRGPPARAAPRRRGRALLGPVRPGAARLTADSRHPDLQRSD